MKILLLILTMAFKGKRSNNANFQENTAISLKAWLIEGLVRNISSLIRPEVSLEDVTFDLDPDVQGQKVK